MTLNKLGDVVDEIDQNGNVVGGELNGTEASKEVIETSEDILQELRVRFDREVLFHCDSKNSYVYCKNCMCLPNEIFTSSLQNRVSLHGFKGFGVK